MGLTLCSWRCVPVALPDEWAALSSADLESLLSDQLSDDEVDDVLVELNQRDVHDTVNRGVTREDNDA